MGDHRQPTFTVGRTRGPRDHLDWSVPSGYIVTEALSASIAGGQDTFTVRLNAVGGTYAGTSASPTTIRAAPSTSASAAWSTPRDRGAQSVILDGDTTPSASDHTYFGATAGTR
jgi:hypothetical protein